MGYLQPVLTIVLILSAVSRKSAWENFSDERAVQPRAVPGEAAGNCPYAPGVLLASAVIAFIITNTELCSTCSYSPLNKWFV